MTLSFVKARLAMLFCFAALSISGTFAQCESCTTAPGFIPDYCHTVEELPGYCAQFQLGSDHFYFQNKAGKTPVKLTMPTQTDLASLLTFFETKAFKFKKATDILFVLSAMENWNKASGTIVADRAAKEVFSKEDLAAKTYTETFDSGLKIEVLHQGEGPKPEKGQNVSVHYRGYTLDGKIFDESFKRGQPITFPVGMGRVIKGWDQGIMQLNLGTRALLYLPASIAYGDRGAGADIPPGATLVFDVVLTKIQ